ncbi:hypothetical protein GGI20_003122, partial [Coemansia sp. BCRC 34301]
MVCLNMRSFALMALAVVAAASPIAQTANEAVAPAALNIPAPPAQAALAPIAPLADASKKLSVTVADAYPNIDASKMGVWVPCSESECMKDMTPEQQAAFKRDCEKMQLSHKANSADGKSRVSNDGAALNFFQMIIPEKDAARLALNNQRVTTIPSLHVVNEKAVAPAQIPHHFATPAPVAPAADSRHSTVRAPVAAAVPHALSPGPNPQMARHEQASEQTVNDVVALSAPNTDSAGPKPTMKQMMLFFPDPAAKMTPEQQHEWAQKFNKSMAEMTPKEREDWMDKVQRSMNQSSQSSNAAKHDVGAKGRPAGKNL